MNESIIELDNLFKKIKENRKTYPLSDTISLEELKEICDSSEQMTSVIEKLKYSIALVYSNQKVFDFLNVTQNETVSLGFKFILNIVHPENIGSIYLLIKFFNEPANYGKKFSNTYYIKTNNGWEWVYNSIKPVTFNEDGTIKYMLSSSCSLEELLKSNQEYRNLRKNLSFFEENIEKYLSMTNQEKEVLVLVAKELTNAEIALMLSVPENKIEKVIEVLIKKLNVKSLIGLTKYALHFQMIK